MKKIGLLALAFGLFACANTQRIETEVCDGQSTYHRGLQDAQKGRPYSPGVRNCSRETMPVAIKRYKDGFTSGSQKLTTENDAGKNRVVQALPVSPPWVCEVEASSKVFTGVGGSAEEATRSARDICGAHFQASYCTQAECKQNL